MSSFQPFLFRAALLAAFACALADEPVSAAQPALVAEGWSLSRLFSNINSRTRVVQFCAGAMALGLFILIKKFAEPGTRHGPGATVPSRRLPPAQHGDCTLDDTPMR